MMNEMNCQQCPIYSMQFYYVEYHCLESKYSKILSWNNIVLHKHIKPNVSEIFKTEAVNGTSKFKKRRKIELQYNNMLIMIITILMKTITFTMMEESETFPHFFPPHTLHIVFVLINYSRKFTIRLR